MSKKLPVTDFEWIKDTSQFNGDFINCNEENIISGLQLCNEKYHQKLNHF